MEMGGREGEPWRVRSTFWRRRVESKNWRRGDTRFSGEEWAAED